MSHVNFEDLHAIQKLLKKAKTFSMRHKLDKLVIRYRGWGVKEIMEMIRRRYCGLLGEHLRTQFDPDFLKIEVSEFRDDYGEFLDYQVDMIVMHPDDYEKLVNHVQMLTDAVYGESVRVGPMTGGKIDV